ncbi:TonB-dependent receptor [Psychrobium sp. MM17-31]|uniref:TonB-dependent receptor n=1 Tax=Psychrobium sp. MM17-31 TaxID=2917758 RepID=UPI001EF436B9|nr:TonB-dependent receptor [Psychrobium sp. MM17-31]MCG7529871.1 TonB-dependent receptor [Psychrobium sp. MM17-31]
MKSGLSPQKSLLSLAVIAGLTGNAYAAESPDSAKKTDYEKIIVTGQKITRTLQETPASIAVFSSDRMEQLELGDLGETLLEAANVHSTPRGLNIRGIDAFVVSGAGSSPLASVYIDNAPMPRRMLANGFSTWDIEQVEILRGPQSTLQGRSSLAGAVIMTSAKPTHEFGGKYRLELGENGQREGAVAVGGSLVEDELAFRFSGEKKSFDGYNFNVTRQEDSDFRDDELYRLKLLYTPQSLPEFSAMLSYTKATTSKGTNGVNVPDEGVDPYKHRIVTNDAPQELNYDTRITNLDINYEISDKLTFKSLTTHAEDKAYWSNYDNDNGPVNHGTRSYQEVAKTLSQEFRLIFEYDNFSGIVGAYYFDREMPASNTGSNRFTLASLGVNAGVLQAGFGLDEATANLVLAQYAAFDPVQLEQRSTFSEDVATKAVFADFTYNVSDELEVFAGIRWDRETNESANSNNYVLMNGDDMPNPANYPAPLNLLIGGINERLLGQLTAANQATMPVEETFSEIVPKIGVNYHINDDVSSSIEIKRGYRSGGAGLNAIRGQAYKYDPEFTTNYEWSLRSLFLDGDLMVNANAFFVDWEDQQVNVQLSANSFDAEIQNAGKSEVKGLEIESFYQLSDEWEFNFSVGLAKTEFTEFEKRIPSQNGEIVRDLSGRRFARAPEWTSNAGVTYTGSNGIFANLNVNYADESPDVVDPDASGTSPTSRFYDPYNDARTLVNLRVGYEWDNYGVFLNAKNLLDEEYIASAPWGEGRRDIRHELGAPRQVSVVFRGTF